MKCLASLKTSVPRTQPTADRRASVVARPRARCSPASHGCPRPAHCIWRLPPTTQCRLRATRPPTTDLPHASD
jgi:hypothetical protein